MARYRQFRPDATLVMDARKQLHWGVYALQSAQLLRLIPTLVASPRDPDQKGGQLPVVVRSASQLAESIAQRSNRLIFFGASLQTDFAAGRLKKTLSLLQRRVRNATAQLDTGTPVTGWRGITFHSFGYSAGMQDHGGRAVLFAANDRHRQHLREDMEQWIMEHFRELPTTTWELMMSDVELHPLHRRGDDIAPDIAQMNRRSRRDPRAAYAWTQRFVRYGDGLRPLTASFFAVAAHLVGVSLVLHLHGVTWYLPHELENEAYVAAAVDARRTRGVPHDWGCIRQHLGRYEGGRRGPAPEEVCQGRNGARGTPRGKRQVVKKEIKSSHRSPTTESPAGGESSGTFGGPSTSRNHPVKGEPSGTVGQGASRAADIPWTHPDVSLPLQQYGRTQVRKREKKRGGGGDKSSVKKQKKREG